MIRINRSFTFEVIIVDDCSTDNTIEVVKEWVRQYSSDVIRILELQENRGKGGAVKQV